MMLSLVRNFDWVDLGVHVNCIVLNYLWRKIEPKPGRVTLMADKRASYYATVNHYDSIKHIFNLDLNISFQHYIIPILFWKIVEEFPEDAFISQEITTLTLL